MKGWSVMDRPGLIDLALSYVPSVQLELLNHLLHMDDPNFIFEKKYPDILFAATFANVKRIYEIVKVSTNKVVRITETFWFLAIYDDCTLAICICPVHFLK